jgi:hypothetical protein
MSRYRHGRAGRTATNRGLGMAAKGAMGGSPTPGNPPIALRCSLLAAEAVKFTVPDAADKRTPLIRCEAENRTCSVPAVADTYVPARQARHLNTVAISVTQRAFRPFGLIFERRHSLTTPSLIFSCVCPAHQATNGVSLTEGNRQSVRLADTTGLM